MAKVPIPDVGTLANSATARQAINDNFTIIEEALENTISRDGTLPNHMEADLDMDSNSVINVADPVADLDAVNLRSVRTVVDSYLGDLSEVIVEGTLRVDTFTATAGQQDFTLTDPPGVAKNVTVFDTGIALVPDLDYTITGDQTLHFLVGRALNAEIMARYVQLSPADSLLRGDLASDNSSKGGTLVTFKREGTDTIARSINDVLEDGMLVSVLDWIPKNQHSAIKAKTTTLDHTSYIQQAIDDVGDAGGGTLYFPRGLYNISATLDVPYYGVTLLGAGASGHYRVTDVSLTRASAASRIAWIAAAPASGTPMVDFRTPDTTRTSGSGGARDICFDGGDCDKARVGVAITSYNYGVFDNVHVMGCSEDGFLLRTASYTIPSSPAATQYNTFRDCKVTAHGGTGAWLTNTCNGFRLTGPKYGAGGLVPTQSGDSSLNSIYSPVLHLAKGNMIFFEGAGQNVVYSPLGKAWAGPTSGYNILFGSADQDSNWPTVGPNINPNAVPAKYNAVFWCEALVAAYSSQKVGGRPSWGNIVWGNSRGNNNDEVVIQQPLTGETMAEITYHSLGRSPDVNVQSSTHLSGYLNLKVNEDNAQHHPIFYLTKHRTGNAAANDGLGKIQWRFTNGAGTDDRDAGALQAGVTSATGGLETVRMSMFPMVSGSQAQECMGWQNGVVMPDGVGPTLAFQGHGTININNGYYVNGLQIVGSRKTGWAAATGTATRTTFNTATVTTAGLAEHFKALIDDLIAHGVIGA